MMDAQNMLQRLKHAGISLAPGMTPGELDRAEESFGFRFPREIRRCLGAGVPVGKGFFDYREVSQENRNAFRDYHKRMEEAFRFDLSENRKEMCEHLESPTDFDAAVLDYFHCSVRLIPFYAHRCFLDGMPIVSFWQPTDVVFYGVDFEDYLEREFLGRSICSRRLPDGLSPEIGIWYQLLR